MGRPRIALLSNPKSSGNLAQLPRMRAFCADHPDIFHYEVEKADQVGAALRTIARVRPKMLVINGGDGTVQATLTELYNGGHFGDQPPPVAVLPSGKTNLIALRHLAEAKGGMAKIAKKAGIERESLYRALSPSGNPRLSITNLKPPFGKTAVHVGAAPRRVTVVLLYRNGLSIRPVNG